MKSLGNTPLLSLALVGTLVGCSHPDESTHTPLAQDENAQTYIHLTQERTRQGVRMVADLGGDHSLYIHKSSGICYEVQRVSRDLVSTTLLENIGTNLGDDGKTVKVAQQVDAQKCKK